MVELPPATFTYGKYGLSSLPWVTIKTTKSYVDYLLSQHIIGYCDSALVEIRPRPDDMAVMFEDETGFEYWVHVAKDVWRTFLEKRK